MEIKMPSNFDLKNSLNFCNFIEDIKQDSEYIYDYSEMNTVEPFGMLLIGSKIRSFYKKTSNSTKHSDYNFEGNGYAAHMGFFKSIYQDYGNDPGEAKGSINYVPITCIDIKDSYLKAFVNEVDIYGYIENIASSLSEVLSRKNPNINKCLKYCFEELIRNVYDHSKSKQLWYAGQYWPTKDLVEVAILDEGTGITSSIKRNRKIIVNSDDEAINLALEPGVSRNLVGKHSNDIYANSGFGLYMTSQICCESNGSFTVCSGTKCINIKNNSKEVFNTSFMGTAIRMRIKPSKVSNIVTEDLSRLGNEKSKEINLLPKISVNSLKDLY